MPVLTLAAPVPQHAYKTMSTTLSPVHRGCDVIRSCRDVTVSVC